MEQDTDGSMLEIKFGLEDDTGGAVLVDADMLKKNYFYQR